jgi:hypothetical protein
MAGDFSIQSTFTKKDMDVLAKAGLAITVLVDLSHNANTTTTEHPSGLRVIAKPVELDIQVNIGKATALSFAELASAKPGTAARDIYSGIMQLGGFSRLQQSNVKAEAPHYAADIVDPTNGALTAPWAAANAPSANAFNALAPNIRRSMGMYRWDRDSHTYSQSGAPDTQPRTAP